MSPSAAHVLRYAPHLAALLVIIMCGRLAAWQFDRADEKRTLMNAWESASAVELDIGGETGAVPAYARVRATGRFDTRRHVLLDNQIRRGRAGVHVFTPFRADGGDALWLVNRGWHALSDRSAPLPEIATPDRRVEISGRLTDPPRVGRQLGRARSLDAGEWPNLVTYLDLERVDEAFEAALAAKVILLDPDHDVHLTGDEWQPVSFGPDRHLAYAWQWITMAVVVALIWIALTRRSLRKS